jgi:hypothetical protein
MLAAVYDPVTPSQASRRALLMRKTFHQDSIVQREARKLANQLMYQQRLEYARRLESNFLDNSLDIDVSTSGASATTLKMKYILAGRVFAHQMSQNTEMWTQLRTLGFRRLELTDGYDFSWAWTVNP